MLRLLGYFVCVFFVMMLLRSVPVVGGLFRIPFLGFFLAVILVGILSERVGTGLLRQRRYQRMARDLGQVDTPHNRGKLGSLLLSQKRYAAAIQHLEAAVEGEPDSIEWAYRLGCAQLGARRPQEAAESLSQVVERESEYAYGVALLRLAEARQAAGEHARVLAALDQYESAYGVTPEGAYRRGRALRSLDRREEANASFDAVGKAVADAARYQRGEAGYWALRAFFARRFF